MTPGWDIVDPSGTKQAINIVFNWMTLPLEELGPDTSTRAHCGDRRKEVVLDCVGRHDPGVWLPHHGPQWVSGDEGGVGPRPYLLFFVTLVQPMCRVAESWLRWPAISELLHHAARLCVYSLYIWHSAGYMVFSPWFMPIVVAVSIFIFSVLPLPQLLEWHTHIVENLENTGSH